MPWSLQTVGSTIFYIPGGSNLPLAGAGTIGTNNNGTIIMVGRGTKSIAVYNITGGTWSIPSTLFSTTGRSVAVGNSKYVAVGEGTNTFAITNNGTTWGTIASPPFSTAGYDIVYAGSTWVAVGTGTNSVAYFDNGTSTWVSVSNGITSGYGLFYDATVPRIWATGSGTNNIAYASAANSTWTGATITGMTQVNAVGSGSGSTIVVNGYAGNYMSFYSNDGTNFSSSVTQWTDINTSGGSALAYGNNLFVWGGSATTGNSMAYSSDGNTWYPITNSGTLQTFVSRIAYGNGRFIACGNKPTSTGSSVITSTNGSSWSALANTLPNGGRGVGYGNGTWIIGGSSNLGMYYSTDNGTNWSSLTGTAYAQITDITYANSAWIATTFNTNTIIYQYGSIFNSWSVASLTGGGGVGGAGNCVKYGYSNTWLAGFNGGSAGKVVLYKSTDNGTNWSSIITYEAAKMTSVTGILYTNNKWFISGAGAAGYQFAYSKDNNPLSISDFTFVSNITTGGGGIAVSPASKLYVAGGIGTNNLQTSSNGTSWTPVTSRFSVAVNDVKNNGTIWVAVGEGGNTIATSSDGSNWTGQGTTTFSIRGNKVRWNSTQNKWYAVGEGGNTLVASTDGTGTSWTSINTTGYVDISGMGLAFN